MKKLTLFAFVVFLNFTCSSQITIRFEWSNDSLNGEYFEKTAMHIPVHFPNDTNTYYFQFDTGADKSYIYSGDFIPKTVIKEELIHSDIGTLTLLKLDNHNAYQENGQFHIGTIGADFLAGKIIEIDFPNQILRILSDYKSSDYTIDSMTQNYGRPVINLKINEKNYTFLFDTGSSLFELWATKKIWTKFKDDTADVKEFPISSWGKINKAYRTNVNQELTLPFCNSIRIETVWYNSNKTFDKGFKSIKLSGILGNKPFLNEIMLIDFKNSKIGVKSCL